MMFSQQAVTSLTTQQATTNPSLIQSFSRLPFILISINNSINSYLEWLVLLSRAYRGLPEQKL